MLYLFRLRPSPVWRGVGGEGGKGENRGQAKVRMVSIGGYPGIGGLRGRFLCRPRRRGTVERGQAGMLAKPSPLPLSHWERG